MSTTSSITATGLQFSTVSLNLASTLTLTNLGPITTAWSAPSSCYQTTTKNTLTDSSTTSLTTEILYVYDVLNQDDGSCNPPIEGESVLSTMGFVWHYPGYEGVMYYSPAACPRGWTTAASLSEVWGMVVASETSAFMCCPSGFTSDQDFATGLMCATDISKGATLTNLVQGGDASHAGYFTPIGNSILQSSSTKLLAGGIRVMYQASDSAVLAGATGTVGVEGTNAGKTTSAVTTSAVLSTETSGGTVVTKTVGSTTIFVTGSGSTTSGGARASGSSNANATTGKGGLSTGAKAGIAVGAAALALALFVLIFIFFRRKGQQRNVALKREISAENGNAADNNTENGTEEGGIIKPETPTNEERSPQTATTTSHEMETVSGNTHELSTKYNSHELLTKHNMTEFEDEPVIVHEIDNHRDGDSEGYPTFHGASINSPAELDHGQYYPAPTQELEGNSLPPRTPQNNSNNGEGRRPTMSSGHSTEYIPTPRTVGEGERRPQMMTNAYSMESLNEGRRAESPKQGESEWEREQRKLALRERMQKIKEEKERLLRMQELHQLEEETAREMWEHEQRMNRR